MHSIRNYFLIAAILFLILNLFYSNNLKIDASSDTLILQNDESFQYFEYYNQIFPSKNFLVLAIQSNKKIEENYIKNINLIQNKLNKIEGVESTFSIVDTPDRKSTRLNSSHALISYAVFCLKKKKKKQS